MALKIESSAFAPDGEIPVRYTFEAEDISPPLSWSGVPPATQSLALAVYDSDAPDRIATNGTWVHWLLYNIPPSATGLSEAAAPLPAGTREGFNDWKRTGYGGPNPSTGRHRYVHKLYALDTILDIAGAPGKAEVDSAMRDHILAEATLTGTYQGGFARTGASEWLENYDGRRPRKT